MIWQDECFLLAKRKFRENATIIDVFTPKYGKMSGIVYGGNSRKIRNHLQVSNKIFVFHTSKNENKIGYFKTELVEPISPKYFSDKERTSALLSFSAILNILLPDSQPYKNIYLSLNDLIKNIDHKNWQILYIFWELNLIKALGFDPDLNIINDKVSGNKSIIFKNIDNINYKIPIYLIKKEIPLEFDKNLLKDSLSFTRNIMLNKFFLPNNLPFPKSRIIFENYFN
jgi:DNA repair protein RecO (recombination protein O)